MKTLYRSLVGVALVVAGAGCAPPAPPVHVNGFELSSHWWRQDARALQARAAFDFHCDDEIELTVISTYPGYSLAAQTVGASGCGKRGTYVRPLFGSTWILNSSDDERPEPKRAARR